MQIYVSNKQYPELRGTVTRSTIRNLPVLTGMESGYTFSYN